MSTTRHHVQTGLSTFYLGGGRTQAEWEVAAKELLDDGRYFLAHDLAKTGLGPYPDSVKLKQFRARALMRLGALDEAREILQALCPAPWLDDADLEQCWSALREAMGLGSPQPTPGPKSLDALRKFVAGSSHDRAGGKPGGADRETLGLLASWRKDLWRESREPKEAQACRDAYLRTFRATDMPWAGINAATMSWILGDDESSRKLAKDVIRICKALTASGDERYWIPASMGEAHLILGHEAEAVDVYSKAAEAPEARPDMVWASVRQLRLMQEYGVSVPDELFGILALPTVVVFTGHMIDRPGQAAPRFPGATEPRVRERIAEVLDEIGADEGYCSAACGSDILFIEAMHERGAKVNVLLPFARADFIRTSVEYAGERWVARFRRATRAADALKYVTEEPFRGDRDLFSLAGRVCHGCARLRAAAFGTEPHLVAVWDGDEDADGSPTAEMVRDWPNEGTRYVIPLDRVDAPTAASGGASVSVPAAAEENTNGPAPSASESHERVVRTMLFADVAGYSKLRDDAVPFYMHEFLARIAERLADKPCEPSLVNTWGDAVFSVMEEALPMAEYALTLVEVICNTDWSSLGLPEDITVRVALHAGPVFEGEDPITRRTNLYGSHVNRAARIEPVTVPGSVYASELFAALLAVEQAKPEAQGDVPFGPFASHYVGKLELPKGFGWQAVYRVRRARQAPRP